MFVQFIGMTTSGTQAELEELIPVDTHKTKYNFVARRNAQNILLIKIKNIKSTPNSTKQRQLHCVNSPVTYNEHYPLQQLHPPKIEKHYSSRAHPPNYQLPRKTTLLDECNLLYRMS